MLSDQDSEIQLSALEGLKALGSKASNSAGEVFKSLVSTGADTQHSRSARFSDAALDALSAMGESGQEQLLKCLDLGDKRIQLGALARFGQVPTAMSSGLSDRLVVFAQSDDAQLRPAALSAMAHTPQAVTEVEPMIVAAVRSSSLDERVAALPLVGFLSEKARADLAEGLVKEHLARPVSANTRSGEDASTAALHSGFVYAIAALGRPALAVLASNAEKKRHANRIVECLSVMALTHPDLSEEVGPLLNTLVLQIREPGESLSIVLLNAATDSRFQPKEKQKLVHLIGSNQEILKEAASRIYLTTSPDMKGVQANQERVRAPRLVIGDDKHLLVSTLSDTVATSQDGDLVGYALQCASALGDEGVEVFRIALRRAEREPPSEMKASMGLYLALRGKPDLMETLSSDLDRATQSNLILKTMIQQLRPLPNDR
jgi:hypothetical protein